ncbi:hypothetical protein SISSUDRAFT_808400 [Sistotremastrum suecicum HHB10207 ss-3]|uniref:PRISE-like Rossmann-fold domain-containing protein n=1 Tax=Sistotremastrum suecicum HHB10207 ss-3 TaxID=1314776 RepID=A0A166CXD5_9AGAM|nr:hypothetical protein SISSUDRAFT_808400 [Sistotremastrum suecicum HHB10207 ss-3]
MSNGYHALVFGASGISGWEACRQLLTYPTASTFSQVTGLTNRPLTREAALLPLDPRLRLISGVDLQKSVEELITDLTQIPNIQTVTHVFYYAYKQVEDKVELNKVNTQMLETAITGLIKLNAPLKHVMLQTGGKAYGPEFYGQVPFPPIPLKESTPRLPEPYASQIFYYSLVDVLARLSQGTSWTFSEVRPDNIIGFAPNFNAMNEAQIFGVYLSLYRAVYGQGAEIPFPSTKTAYKIMTTESSTETLIRYQIHLALHPDKFANGEAFNEGDKAASFETKWPAMAAYFGLKGVPPKEDNPQDAMEKWVWKHKDVWDKLEKEYDLKPGAIEGTGWWFGNFVIWAFWDRPYDLSKMKAVGFEEEGDTVKGYYKSWDLYRKAKIIPDFPSDS